MPGSVTSVFSEAEDFEAALHEESVLGLLITGIGQFRARLTQVALHRLRLAAGDEQLSWIAFVAVPANIVVVSSPIGDRAALIWGGVEMRAGEMIILGPGQRIHAQTDRPCRWGVMRLPGEDLARYGRALSGTEFVVPRAPHDGDPRPRPGGISATS